MVISNSTFGHTTIFPLSLTGQSNFIFGHTTPFLLSLTGQKNAGGTSDVYVGHVGTPDAVTVLFEVVMVAEVELERVGLWRMASERGRALGRGVNLGLGIWEGDRRPDNGADIPEGEVYWSTQGACAVFELRMELRCGFSAKKTF